MYGTTIGVIRGDTRSLDYSSYSQGFQGCTPKVVRLKGFLKMALI